MKVPQELLSADKESPEYSMTKENEGRFFFKKIKID